MRKTIAISSSFINVNLKHYHIHIYIVNDLLAYVAIDIDMFVSFVNVCYLKEMHYLYFLYFYYNLIFLNFLRKLKM